MITISNETEKLIIRLLRAVKESKALCKNEVAENVTNEEVNEFVENALRSRYLHFLTSDNKLNFSPVIIRTQEGAEVSGYVIEKITMLGKPYYKILYDGEFMKVPESHVVKILEKGEGEKDGD